MSKAKGADEVFCRSCGEAIKKEAEICPGCGVRNQAAEPSSGSRSASTVAANGQYETTVSNNWYYGVAISIVLWIVLFVVSGFATDTFLDTLLGLIAIAAWALMPLSIYFDAKYVRANSKWDPKTVAYVIGSLIFILNIIVGAVYLYRRHETLGEP